MQAVLRTPSGALCSISALMDELRSQTSLVKVKYAVLYLISEPVRQNAKVWVMADTMGWP